MNGATGGSGKKMKDVMKVIGFRPKPGSDIVVKTFEQALINLGVKRTELAREAFEIGLEPAIHSITQRRRNEAIETLKRLKIVKA